MGNDSSSASTLKIPARAAFLDILDRYVQDAAIRLVCSDGEWIVGAP